MDRKPSVPLLTSKNLDKLSVHNHRCCMQLMRFQFTTIHIPGSDPKITDTLSQSHCKSNRNRQTVTERYCYFCCTSYRRNVSNSKKVTGDMPSSGARQHNYQQLMLFCREGWPHHSKLIGNIKLYKSVAINCQYKVDYSYEVAVL